MFQWLIVHTITTAALTAVVLAASRWFRLGPAARHILWLVVVVKFLTPPVVYWPWALPMRGPAPAETAPAPAALPVGVVRTVIIDMPADFGPGQDAADALPLTSVATPLIAEPSAAPPITWNWLPAAVGWTWLVGGAMAALLQAMRILRWRRRLWWHPLFWWVRRRLGQEAELACDAAVVGAAPAARRAYAEAILEVSQRMSAVVAVPALGAAGGRRDLERRLVMIMRGPASRRLSWVGLAGAIALGLLALPAWTLGDEKTLSPQPAVTAPAAPAVTTAPEGSYYQPVTTYRKVTTSAPVTSYQLVSPSSAPVAPPTQAAVPDRDQKLRELEDKVQQLLKEMQQLRGQAPTGGMTPPGGVRQTTQPSLITPQEAIFGFLTASSPVRVVPALAPPTVQADPAPSVRAQGGVEVITLTRVSYKLNPTTADALSVFLKDNVKTAILETKSEGDNLVVTTTPDAQQAIGQFIHLLQGPTTGPTPMKSVRPRNVQPGAESRPPLPIDPSPSLERLPPAPVAPAPPGAVPPPKPEAPAPAAPGGLPATPPAATPFSPLGATY